MSTYPMLTQVPLADLTDADLRLVYETVKDIASLGHFPMQRDSYCLGAFGYTAHRLGRQISEAHAFTLITALREALTNLQNSGPQ